MQMLCPPPIPLLGLYRVGDGFRKGQTMQMLCPPPIPLLGLYRVGDGFRKGQTMQMLYPPLHLPCRAL